MLVATCYAAEPCDRCWIVFGRHLGGGSRTLAPPCRRPSTAPASAGSAIPLRTARAALCCRGRWGSFICPAGGGLRREARSARRGAWGGRTAAAAGGGATAGARRREEARGMARRCVCLSNCWRQQKKYPILTTVDARQIVFASPICLSTVEVSLMSNRDAFARPCFFAGRLFCAHAVRDHR